MKAEYEYYFKFFKRVNPQIRELANPFRFSIIRSDKIIFQKQARRPEDRLILSFDTEKMTLTPDKNLIIHWSKCGIDTFIQ